MVQPFAGPESSGLRQALIRNLEASGRYQVVPSKTLKKAQAMYKIKRLRRAEDYQSMGYALRSPAFIQGRVRRARRQWTLVVTVRDAMTGDVAGRSTWSGRTLANLRAVGRNGAKRLEPKLAATQIPNQPAAQRAEAKPKPKPKPPRQKPAPVKRAEVKPKPRPKPQPVAIRPPDVPPESGPAPADPANGEPGDPNAPWYAKPGDEEDAPSETPAAGADKAVDRYTGLLLSAGVGGQYRDASAQVGVYERFRNPSLDPTSTNIINEERLYQSSGLGHPEVNINLELYPGALLDKQVFPWLGLVGSFSHSLSVGLQAPPCSQGGCPTANVDLSVSQLEVYVGARGRYRFGDKARSALIFADVGWGMFSFDIDTNDLAQVARSDIFPPMEYNYVYLGAGIQYGLIPTYLTAKVFGGGRLGLVAGSDMREVWGTETPPSNGFSVGLELRSEAPYLFDGAFFALAVQYFQFSTKFRGQTACRTGNCGDSQTNTPELWEPWPFEPGNEDVLSPGGGVLETLKDSYVRFGVSFGYLLR